MSYSLYHKRARNWSQQRQRAVTKSWRRTGGPTESLTAQKMTRPTGPHHHLWGGDMSGPWWNHFSWLEVLRSQHRCPLFCAIATAYHCMTSWGLQRELRATGHVYYNTTCFTLFHLQWDMPGCCRGPCTCQPTATSCGQAIGLRRTSSRPDSCSKNSQEMSRVQNAFHCFSPQMFPSYQTQLQSPQRRD